MFIATILCGVMLSTSGVAMAQSLQDKIGMDKIAHFGAGYIIADQLKKHTKMSALERSLTVATLATIKEATDSKFDTNDILATMLGATFLQISGKF